MKFKVFVVVTVLLVPVSGVYAELHDRGGGLIYDDVLDITWLQDANLAVSETFGASVISTTGQIDWDTAIRWIEAMNASSYLGFNQWRLPKIMPINGASYVYEWSYDGSTDQGYNISAPISVYPFSTGSELAFLFHNSLGNIGQRDIDGKGVSISLS